jgi:hypothetical protein
MFSKFTTRYVPISNNAHHAAWRDPKNSIALLKVKTAQTAPSKSEGDTALLSEPLINRARAHRLKERVGINFATVKAEKVEEPDYLAAYNLWLKEYLLSGGKATHFYDYPCRGMEVITDGHSYRPRTNSKRILSPGIDVWEYCGITASSRDYRNMHGVFGWEKQGKKPITYGIFVPVYTNTIDKEMMYDKSVPKKIRHHLLKGVAESKEQSRATKLREIFWQIHGEVLGNEPRTPMRNQCRSDAEYVSKVLEMYVASKCNSDAPALNYTRLPMYVDFNKGDGWSFKSFLYEDSGFYHLKDTNPARYLGNLVERRGSVTVTFINKESAVVTRIGASSNVPLPLICLTAEMPLTQDLTGYSYTISSMNLGEEWEPASIAFLTN